MRGWFDLFCTFCRIGGLTFGGGYAMLPMIQSEVVEKHGWATNEEVLDFYAVSQCLPGIIAVNTAAFIGHKQKGIRGGMVAAAGMVAPALVVIMVIASFIQNFAHLTVVKDAFAGIRACVVILIVNAVMTMWKSSVIDRFTLVIFLATGVTSFALNWSPVLYILVAAALGVLLKKGRKK